MDLDYPAEAEAFRLEVRAWLDENLPAGFSSASPDQRQALLADWNDKLIAGNWLCASWPVEYGGRGLSTMQGVVLSEEFHRAGAPLRADFFGDTLVGPTILQWGTEAQKQEFIPKILRGEIAWCQGFSEPDAGSDLAALKTTAVLDGDEWIINGQKIWTTQGLHADYVFVLCRTDPAAPRHKGISYLLCPMDQPGVEVRGIRQIDGGAEFCEVFFTNARCAKDNVVGGVNDGWKVAMTTLGFERGTSATTGYHRFRAEREELFASARRTGRSADPVVRQQLAQSWIVTEIMRVNGYRSLTNVLLDRSEPGLEMTHKVFWSDYSQWSTKLAIDVLGMDGQLLTGTDTDVRPGSVGLGRRPQVHHYPASPLQQSFFFARGESIYGGTSEIQRNLVAERVLGLPKGP